MLSKRNELCIFSGGAHPKLAQNIAKHLGVELGEVEITKFPDGEILVQYIEHIRGKDVFIIQPTCHSPNENIMELLIMLDAAKRASAGRVTAVIPYYGYARQDRKDKSRVPITAKLVADLLTTAGADRILTVDLHAQQIMGFFDIPLDHLIAAPVLLPYLKGKLGDNPVVVSPDSGSVKMATMYSRIIGADLAVIAKNRRNAVAVDASHLVGDVDGRTCLIVDDMTSTAGTLITAADLLFEKGAKEVFAAVSHCPLTELGVERINKSRITEIISTDTVPTSAAEVSEKVTILSASAMLGEGIRAIHDGESLSKLFEIEIQHAECGKISF